MSYKVTLARDIQYIDARRSPYSRVAFAVLRISNKHQISRVNYLVRLRLD